MRIASLAAAAFVLVSCAVPRLRDASTLKADFNAADGHTRVIVLLSPT